MGSVAWIPNSGVNIDALFAACSLRSGFVRPQIAVLHARGVVTADINAVMVILIWLSEQLLNSDFGWSVISDDPSRKQQKHVNNERALHSPNEK